jgi:hypothetical protein
LNSRFPLYVCLVCLVLASYAGYRAYRWKQMADASIAYLFAPTDVKDDKGQPVSRFQLLDMIIVKALAK